MSQALPVMIRGVGAAAPSQVLHNDFFASYLDTSDEWIFPRTGIRERRKAAEGETTLTLALEASKKALDHAGMSAEELDLIVVCTVTPETPLPATACWLQHELGVSGMDGAPAFDVVAACSGFVYGMVAASLMMSAGTYRNALIVGVETLTRITDYQDRATCILFGDGAGAAVLSKSSDPQRGILHCEMGADGSKTRAVWIPGGGSKEPISARVVDERLHFMRMNGRELFKNAVLKMEELIDRAVKEAGVQVNDIKLIIPHQSNRRIMELVRSRVGLAPEKMLINIERYGNTSAASIPLALDEVWRAGEVGPGDLVLLLAFGAGVTWGSVLIRL